MSRGFTLIEIIIVIGIFTSVMIVISLFVLDIANNEIFFTESINSEVETRQAYQTIISELRSMGGSVNGSYAINAASSSSFTFFSDSDGDGYTEQVRYFVDGGILKKGLIKPAGNPFGYKIGDEKITEAVHYLVSNNVFSYFGANYDGNQSPLGYPINLDSIRMIKIQLSIDKDPNVLPGKVVLPAYINMRNLRGI